MTEKQLECIRELLAAIDGLSPSRRAAMREEGNPALAVFVTGWAQACQWAGGAPTVDEAIPLAYAHLNEDASA